MPDLLREASRANWPGDAAPWGLTRVGPALRDALDRGVGVMGAPLDWTPPRQLLHTRALGGLLRLCADPDHVWVGDAGDSGVPLGVDSPPASLLGGFSPEAEVVITGVAGRPGHLLGQLPLGRGF